LLVCLSGSILFCGLVSRNSPMHPILLTFPDVRIEKAFLKKQLKSSTRSEWILTWGLLALLSVGIISDYSDFRDSVGGVLIGLLLLLPTLWRRAVARSTLQNFQLFLCGGLHILWLSMFYAIAEKLFSSNYEFAYAMCIRTGAWLAITWNSSPLPTYMYVPVQLLIVAGLISLELTMYAEDDRFAYTLLGFWDLACSWNEVWLIGLDQNCPKLPFQEKARRSHAFILLIMGLAVPGLLKWVWEAKNRQKFFGEYQKQHAITIGQSNFVPVSYTVVIMCVAFSLAWKLISSTGIMPLTT